MMWFHVDTTFRCTAGLFIRADARGRSLEILVVCCSRLHHHLVFPRVLSGLEEDLGSEVVFWFDEWFIAFGIIAWFFPACMSFHLLQFLYAVTVQYCLSGRSCGVISPAVAGFVAFAKMVAKPTIRISFATHHRSLDYLVDLMSIPRRLPSTLW